MLQDDSDSIRSSFEIIPSLSVGRWSMDTGENGRMETCGRTDRV